MKYCLLRIAYDSSFHGFQIQPKVRTVQGEITKALSPIGVRKIYGSSRTDSGVRSASSIIEVEHPDVEKVCSIVDSIKGVSVRGYYESDEFVNLRKSLEKEYVYFCDHRLNGQVLKEAVSEFVSGKFESFSKDPHKSVILSGVTFHVGKSHTIFLFRGKSFSWNFVRIAAETIIKRSEGRISDGEWKDLISGKKKSKYKGRPDNLILYRTNAPFEFKNYESRNIGTLKSKIFQELYWLSGIHQDIKDIVDSLKFLNE